MTELRNIFYKIISDLMKENSQIVYLDADLAGALGTAGLFEKFPEQAFDLGIMEANMIGVHKGKDSFRPYFWTVCFQKSCGSDFFIRLL